MRMISLAPLTAFAALGVASAALAGEGDYPFLGMWDCEIAVLTFSADHYHDGTNDYPMTDVTEGSGAYTIKLTDDYIIGLSGISANKMSFAPMVGGDLFACFRLE